MKVLHFNKSGFDTDRVYPLKYSKYWLLTPYALSAIWGEISLESPLSLAMGAIPVPVASEKGSLLRISLARWESFLRVLLPLSGAIRIPIIIPAISVLLNLDIISFYQLYAFLMPWHVLKLPAGLN